MDGFRFTHEIEVRFRDLDLLGHVNNAVYVTYLEVARTQYYGDVLEMGFGEADDVDFNVVNVEVDFRRPIEFEDKVEVGVRTVDVGESSMTTEYEVEVDGELAAEASSVQVAVDDDGRPTRVPDSWRERFREYEDGFAGDES